MPKNKWAFLYVFLGALNFAQVLDGFYRHNFGFAFVWDVTFFVIFTVFATMLWARGYVHG